MWVGWYYKPIESTNEDMFMFDGRAVEVGNPHFIIMEKKCIVCGKPVEVDKAFYEPICSECSERAL